VTDTGTGNSHTDISVRMTYDEMSVLLSTMNRLMFPIQPLGQSILVVTQDMPLFDTALYRSTLTLASPSLSKQNFRKDYSHTATSENRRKAKEVDHCLLVYTLRADAMFCCLL
jgi:hypothetical protein